MEKYHGNTIEYWKQNAEEDYNKTPMSVLKYITVLEEQSLNIHDVNGSSIQKQPAPPLNRVLREGVGHFCTNCGSTVSRNGFIGLFGEMLCHNEKCPNSKSKKNYR